MIDACNKMPPGRIGLYIYEDIHALTLHIHMELCKYRYHTSQSNISSIKYVSCSNFQYEVFRYITCVHEELKNLNPSIEN